MSRSQRSNNTATTDSSAEMETTFAQTSTLTDPNFSVPEHAKGREITRKIILQWDNNLAALSAKPSQATWRPLDGHYDIFQSSTRYAPNCARAAVRRGNLEQVIMIGMKVKKVESNFPCQLGLTINGVKGNYYTCNGERYSYLISANERSLNLDEIVATTNPYVNSEYLERFPGMTAKALRTEGIMHVPNENYVFVDHKHPIVEMMQENHEALQLDLSQAQLIDGRWYKVAKPVTERCLNELESELVNNLPIYDLTKFNAKISRPYNLEWDAETEICDNITLPNMKNKVMQAERRCTVVLEVTYLFM
jgi:hypothetical protein